MDIFQTCTCESPIYLLVTRDAGLKTTPASDGTNKTALRISLNKE